MPKFAVIAVHGVGSPQPGAMAREIAGLLQAANPGRYAAFEESLLEVRVSKEAALTSPGELKVATGTIPPTRKPWYVRSEFVSRNAGNAPTSASGHSAFVELGQSSEDIEFSRQAVEHAEVDAPLSRYRTVMLRSTRGEAGNSRQVDVYELHWGDLSRLGGFIGRILGEFYQILFHLAALGQKTVELAWLRSVGAEKFRLSMVLRAQAVAEWMLAGAIPVLSLALILAIAPWLVIDLAGSDEMKAALCGAVLSLPLVALGLYRLWSRLDGAHPGDPRDTAIRGCLAVFIGVAFAITAGFWLLARTPRFLEASLFVLMTGLGMATFFILVRMLVVRRTPAESRAPIVARAIGAGTWILLLLLGLVPFFGGQPLSLSTITMRIAEGLFLCLAIAWPVFMAAGWATWLAGTYASSASPDWRVKSAVWTGKIGLFVPGALFFLVNLVAWHLIAGFFNERVGRSPYNSLVSEASAFLGFELPGCPRAEFVSECVDQLIASSAGAGFNAFAVTVAAAGALLVVALLPSLIYESAPGIIDREKSVPLGHWLDSGIVLSRYASHLLFTGLLVLLPGLAAYQLFHGGMTVDTTALKVLGTLLVAAGGAAIALRGALFKGLTRTIGIAFDVDNWMKERPLEKNPRGRILLRYISLLGHIAREGYDRVVIVSHSQGTVISADLLRYLRRYPCSSLVGLPPIRLMTFGCPLRQLYGARFPHLYEWAITHPVSPHTPDFHTLYAVERWSNCYRSGDYVGRSLWTRKDAYAITAAPSASLPEICLEAGAHTHYFDATATLVGQVIDQNLQ